MKFESKFGPKDKVYKISHSKESIWEECKFCDGEGVIIGKDSSPRSCPVCYGRKGEMVYKDLKWMVESVPLTIGQIRIEFTPKSTENLSDLFDNYKAQSENYIESYMCYESGIGSGSVYYLKDLFSSLSAAQAECDKRNSSAE